MKPIKNSKLKKMRGIRNFCKECRAPIFVTCKLTGKKIESCPHVERHILQAVVGLPGTNARKMKFLETRDINVAISQALEFRKKVLEDFKEGTSEKNGKKIIKANLAFLISWYKEWLMKSDDITLFERIRTGDHMKNIEKCFKDAAMVWRRRGFKFNEMTLGDLNAEMVRELFQYYYKERNYRPRTINKYLGYWKTFIKRASEEHNLDVRNYFEKYKQLPVKSDPNAISIDTYHRLIEAINNPDYKKSGKVGDDWRFFYRSYLVPAIKLGLHTGRRREELINIKFKDEFIDDGARFFKVEDYKNNRIQNRTTEQDNKKYIVIPVTKGLQRVLDELNYDELKGTDNYVLAPELNRKRNRRMSDIISRGFAHYYHQIEPEGTLGFGSLRKRYISELVKFFGSEAKGVSQHSNNSVIEKHYLDKKVLMKAASDFDPEGQKNDREHELKSIRELGNNSNEISIEK